MEIEDLDLTDFEQMTQPQVRGWCNLKLAEKFKAVDVAMTEDVEEEQKQSSVPAGGNLPQQQRESMQDQLGQEDFIPITATQ